MKQHYKMYKAGKLWLTACLVTLGLLGFAGTANADTTTAQANVPQSSQVDGSAGKQAVTNINGFTESGGAGNPLMAN